MITVGKLFVSHRGGELRQIVEIIECEGMMAIPAFENLDHIENFLSYPEFEDLAECPSGGPIGRGLMNCKNGTCGCVSNPRLYEVMDKYITEVSGLFSSEYIHMGLDEPFDFCICDKCHARLAEGETKEDMFYIHVMKSYELAKKLGKTMLMWDDFFEWLDIVDRLPRDIIMCNWNYTFIGSQPMGHWTNRKSRDWFRLYNKLGFKYMFCTKAHDCSAPYNVDSFTRYAKKYSPIGAVMTEWGRAAKFYLCTYPVIAYAGMLWSGNGFDKTKLYTEILGSRELALVLTSLNIPINSSGISEIHKMCEDDYYLAAMLRPLLEYALKKFEDEDKNDVAVDIYNSLLWHYLDLRIQALGTEIFNIREGGGCDFGSVLCELDEIESGYRKIEKSAYGLWEKYRSGIKSSKSMTNEFEPDAMLAKYSGAYKKIDKIRDALKNEKERVGILYADLMLHEAFATVRGGFRIKYEDSGELVSVSGNIKHSLVNYEAGGCYHLRFKI